MVANLLEVCSLTKHFPVTRGLLRRQPLGYVRAVDGVDFAIKQGETFGKDIQQERGIAYLLISHDMASVEYLCHRVGVMSLGKLVEVGSAEAVCSRPRHPYTATLIAAATPPGRPPPWPVPLMGEVPNPLDAPSGCTFHPRCPYAMPECRQVVPPLREVEPQRWVACHLYPDQIQRVLS